MAHLTDDFYNDLAQMLITDLYDYNRDDGVVELNVEIGRGRTLEVLFAYSVTDLTLSYGLGSLNYLIIAFEHGVRCSVDFDSTRLDYLIDI